MADSDTQNIILGLIANTEATKDKQGTISRIAFTTRELSDDKRLGIPKNQSARDTAKLFIDAVRPLGLGDDDIKVNYFTDLKGTVEISGTPAMIESLIKAADAALKKQSMKTSLEQFNDPTYQAQANAEQTLAQAVPNVKTPSTDITRA